MRAALVAHQILLVFIVLIAFWYRGQMLRNIRKSDTSTEPTSYC